jgi:hypothetical protein
VALTFLWISVGCCLARTAPVCDDPREVARIDGPARIEIGEELVLDGSASNGGPGDEAEPITFRWDVVSGPASIVEAADHPTVRIIPFAFGTIRVRLTVDDGSCGDPASAEVRIFIDEGPLRGAVRCDANGDGALDISDAVRTLSIFFSGGQPAECAPSLDCNRDRSIDIADPIQLLGELFLGAPLPASFGACEEFAGCPGVCR